MEWSKEVKCGIDYILKVEKGDVMFDKSGSRKNDWVSRIRAWLRH